MLGYTCTLSDSRDGGRRLKVQASLSYKPNLKYRGWARCAGSGMGDGLRSDLKKWGDTNGVIESLKQTQWLEGKMSIQSSLPDTGSGARGNEEVSKMWKQQGKSHRGDFLEPTVHTGLDLQA